MYSSDVVPVVCHGCGETIKPYTSFWVANGKHFHGRNCLATYYERLEELAERVRQHGEPTASTEGGDS